MYGVHMLHSSLMLPHCPHNVNNSSSAANLPFLRRLLLLLLLLLLPLAGQW
jgi:hypothetical protein